MADGRRRWKADARSLDVLVQERKLFILLDLSSKVTPEFERLGFLKLTEA